MAFELHAIEGGEHGPAQGKPEEIAEAYRKVCEFVKRELHKPARGADSQPAKSAKP